MHSAARTPSRPCPCAPRGLPRLRHDRTRPAGDSLNIDAEARGYPDLHDHLAQLEAHGQVVRVDRAIDKDAEMHPLVRWQFRGGLPEQARKAFLFTNVVDGSGHRFDVPVLVGGLASNREIYRLGMGCELDEIGARWATAMSSPVAPIEVDDAPCHELVVRGEALTGPRAGLDGIPVPVSTPGWDNAPYTTTSHFITRDPDTGIQNVGNYRGQFKAPLRLGMNPSVELTPGIYTHWLKYRDRGEPMPCAVVLGAPPAVTFAAVQKVPPTTGELSVAGALAGAPIHTVRAKTVDIHVPAWSEIVVEGYIATDALEPEGPVGESHGHVNLQEYNAFLEVTAITRRRDAVLTSIISQVTPSESSLIKRVAYEPMFLAHLRDQLGIRSVVRVGMHEPLTNIRKVILVQVQRGTPETEVWRALYGAASFQRSSGKYVIAVDEDIDPDNADAILWAMSYRSNPERDLRVLSHQDPGHGPQAQGSDAAVLVNATLRGDYPPISLPKREFMERARDIWNELGLPPLSPQAPWYGYSLGDWPERLEREAELATQGRYFEVGEEAAQRRRRDVEMNQPIDELGG
ncbi:MAG: UbiD family decarboxylase [Nitriliruptorales bacterium]|nr:UbiD family decarboxylase [Nitriliruptorales bacterium]